MLSPPSLPFEVLVRAFRAPNGELGVLPTDVGAFLEACETDEIDVLGWELWLVDHAFDPAQHAPRPAPGQWCGAILTLESPLPTVLGGAGEADAVRQQIATMLLPELVETKWLPYLRYNFKLDG